MEKQIKASYTLSDNKTIYVSKNKRYVLHHDGKAHYIIDNTGSRMDLQNDELRDRFEFV